MRRTIILLSLILVACGQDEKPNADDLTLPTSIAPTIRAADTPLSPDSTTQTTRQVFSGQNTITLADGSSATYLFSLAHPPEWTADAGEVMNIISSRDPLAFPMQAGDVQISFSFRPFVLPDLTTLEQALPGAPTMPITLAGYAGLRADFSDQAATFSEGSTLLLRLDDDAFLFVTLQMAYGERATLEVAALDMLGSLSVRRDIPTPDPSPKH